MHAKSLQSCLDFVTPQTVAHQAPLSMGFSGQEHWSGLSCPPPGNLPNPGIEPVSFTSPASAGEFWFFFPPLLLPGKPKYKTQNHRSPTREHRQNIL